MTAKKDLQKIAKNLRKGIGFTTSIKSMNAIGLQMIELIVARTRKGLGVSKTGAKAKRLKPLSRAYVQRRKVAKNLSSLTRPGKSNLTFTGIMLDSMRVLTKSPRFVRVGPNERRRKGGVTNREIAEFVSEDRPFNNLSDTELNKMARFIDRILRRSFKNNNL